MSLPSKVVVITGANRGLGEEFVNQLLFTQTAPHPLLTPAHFCENDNYTVVALSRNINQTQVDAINAKLNDFNKLHNTQRKFIPFQCDVTNLTQINSMIEMIKADLNGRIDIFISNAGVAGTTPGSSVKDIVDFDQDIDQMFHINTIAPVVLTNLLSPLLTTAAQSVAALHKVELPTALTFDSTKDPSETTLASTITQQYAQCAYLSSTMGSIAQCNAPLTPTYRATKAALNMYVRTLSFEYPHINCLIMHPGWVATDMGSRGGRTPPVQPPQSISGMLNLMSKYCTQEQSGMTMVGFDDQVIPW